MSAVNVGMHANAANSCATCHNGGKAFGATDFANCRKCHAEMGSARGFGIAFDHTVHAKSNCATCHKTVGKGVNFTVPNGTAAHNTCFQCHQPMKGGGAFLENKCFTCHKVGDTNNIQPSKAAIAGNFAHSKHGFLDCDSCHTPAAGKFNLPAVAMHKASGKGLSCATCHNNEGAFGEDFTSCKRCHTGSNFKF
jgi:c(7)-type cytochrome triheme protein